jgi:hypothetical protein
MLRSGEPTTVAAICLSKARGDYDQMVVLNDRDRHGK